MGLLITRDTFEEHEFARFGERLEVCLGALSDLLAQPSFGAGETTIGAELELFLVGADGRPLSANREVLARTVDPRFTVEMDRFNLEFNACPRPLAGKPFSGLAAELSGALVDISRAAAEQGGRIVTVGMLPTLRREDLTASDLTDSPRYRAMSRRLRALRGGPFHVRIQGDDPLDVESDDVALEGACTSFQVHLRVPPERYARFYNAAQIATIPALAAAGNSPLLIGHRLWEETRIALFKQAVDDREGRDSAWLSPSRVSYGHGWVREGAFELFAESVRLHAPILPVIGHEDPCAALAEGRAPALSELRLHHGTVWRWNRAVYDPAGGGHLRIEMRALPAGPTIADMTANAAFLLGLTFGLAPHVDELLAAYPFDLAQYAFYRAAQRGLDAVIPWPSASSPSPCGVPLAELCERLLPLAREGLFRAGVEPSEIDENLGVFAARVASRKTGARFQRRALESFSNRYAGEDARRALLERYEANVATGRPVHEWAIP